MKRIVAGILTVAALAFVGCRGGIESGEAADTAIEPEISAELPVDQDGTYIADRPGKTFGDENIRVGMVAELWVDQPRVLVKLSESIDEEAIEETGLGGLRGLMTLHALCPKVCDIVNLPTSVESIREGRGLIFYFDSSAISENHPNSIKLKLDRLRFVSGRRLEGKLVKNVEKRPDEPGTEGE